MIFKNEAKSVFQITGIINAAVEIGTLTRDEDQSIYDFYFEQLKSIGKNVGKLVHISFELDPDWREKLMEENKI